MTRNLSRNRPDTDHQQAARELRRHPRQWREVSVYRTRQVAAATARLVRSGGLPAYLPAGHFEARVELHEDGTALTARYVGPAALERPRAHR